MNKMNSNMTITELSRSSGISVSAIKFYIREGLLPKCIILKGTRRYYTIRHLERLNQIKKFKKEGIKISQIKGIFNILQNKEEKDYTPKAITRKFEIIDTVMTLFQKKGYEAVTITDITNAANIGCSTFYKHFKSKQNLFIECIQKIISDEARQFDEIRTDQEVYGKETFHREAEIFFNQYILWRDMIKNLRAASISNPAEFSEKFDEMIQLKINLFEKQIAKAMQEGYIRKLNKTLLAVMVIGVMELCSDYFIKPEYSDIYREEILLEEAKDIFLHGILKK
jgi:AcrR family transcriptional regulator